METIHWAGAVDETTRHLQSLLRAETTNPPGNEAPAIAVVKEILDQEAADGSCLSYTILEPAPGRVNLIARLKGDGTLRPLLLSGHVDVVPVERERWTHDPFGGELIDGMIWGRGALDMKGFLSMYLQVFLQAYRQRLPLKRDLILAAIADEEDGFEYGSKFLVEQHKPLIDAEYGFTEGGAFTLHLGKTRLYPIQVAEKGVCWLRMTASGQPGHGSLPHDDNAVAHLAQALDRLRQARHLPFRLTPAVRSMLEAGADQVAFPGKLLLLLLKSPSVASLLLPVLPPKARSIVKALYSNSLSPTMLAAGVKANVIPSDAAATLDCRLLPGQTPADAMREIQKITGSHVHLEPISTTSGAQVPASGPVYEVLEKVTRKLDPGGIVIPMISTGATDAHQYQRAGIQVYGFTPGILPPELPLIELAHGHDERIPVSFIESGLPVLWEAVREITCG